MARVSTIVSYVLVASILLSSTSGYKGHLDGANHATIWGWACDETQPFHLVTVRLELSDGYVLGYILADRVAEDPVGDMCGGFNDHRWLFPVTPFTYPTYVQGTAPQVHAFVNGTSFEINASPIISVLLPACGDGLKEAFEACEPSLVSDPRCCSNVTCTYTITECPELNGPCAYGECIIGSCVKIARPQSSICGTSDPPCNNPVFCTGMSFSCPSLECITPSPTDSPSEAPTDAPTTRPTVSPTAPTMSPTLHPTVSPTNTPTSHPTRTPTTSPTVQPTFSPTRSSFPRQLEIDVTKLTPDERKKYASDVDALMEGTEHVVTLGVTKVVIGIVKDKDADVLLEKRDGNEICLNDLCGELLTDRMKVEPKPSEELDSTIVYAAVGVAACVCVVVTAALMFLFGRSKSQSPTAASGATELTGKPRDDMLNEGVPHMHVEWQNTQSDPSSTLPTAISQTTISHAFGVDAFQKSTMMQEVAHYNHGLSPQLTVSTGETSGSHYEPLPQNRRLRLDRVSDDGGYGSIPAVE